MDVFVYFPDLGPELEGRDELEDALSDAFGDSGSVTGGGGGIHGSNVDLEVSDDFGEDQALTVVRSTLDRLKVPLAKIVINGKEHLPRFPE